MNCDIFIRSYYKDFVWLRYALRSIEKFCKGFSRIIVVVPESSRQRLDWLGLARGEAIICPDYRDDYLGQQVTKLTADAFTSADFICHIDSDCVFRQPTRPQDLLEEGKPRVLMAPYSRLDPHVPWKPLVEGLLLQPVEYEFMRIPPYTFPRWLYQAFREHVALLHGRSLEDYVLNQPPRGFSEFNALSAFAFHYHASTFHWIDENNWPLQKHHCQVHWSWGGMDDKIKEQLEALLA